MEQYKVVIGSSRDTLEENVNHFLNLGWLLSGGVAIEVVHNVTAYYQAVYKPKA